MTPSGAEELEMNPFFNAVFARVSGRINQLTTDDNNRHFYKSLLTGGITMANAVIVKCQGVRDTCSSIDKEKALALTRLFTLLMLSQAFRWLENRNAETEEPKTVNLTAVSNILGFFDDNSEEAVKDFVNMDAQFRYDLKHHDHMTHMAVLLLAKACEACGHKCIEWDKVSFPVKSMIPLTSSGAIVDSLSISSLNDITLLWECHAAGVKSMVNYHEEQTKS